MSKGFLIAILAINLLSTAAFGQDPIALHQVMIETRLQKLKGLDHSENRYHALQSAYVEMLLIKDEKEKEKAFKFLHEIADVMVAEGNQRNSLFLTKDDILSKYKEYSPTNALNAYAGILDEYTRRVSNGSTGGIITLRQAALDYIKQVNPNKSKHDREALVAKLFDGGCLSSITVGSAK